MGLRDHPIGAQIDKIIREQAQYTDALEKDMEAVAEQIQMSMDGSASIDVGAKLNRLEQKTEEMVETATGLAARYEAGSHTFDATLREAEAKIKEEMDSKLEESIQRYTEAVKQHAISVHRHTDAGPFVLHLMEAVAFHRMNVRMVRQRFCAESIGMLLAPILSQGKNAFTITITIKFYAHCLTRDVPG